MSTSPPSSAPWTTGTGALSRAGFAQVSRFLLADAANPDTQALRASLLLLSGHIEQTTQARRARRDLATIDRQAAVLAQHARHHQLLLTGLGSAWHVLYEFGVYQRALHALRAALQDWRSAMQQHEASEAARFAQFERLAWRTLGEALLVLDLYEQQSAAPPLPARSHGVVHPRRPALWTRLRRWLAKSKM